MLAPHEIEAILKQVAGLSPDTAKWVLEFSDRTGPYPEPIRNALIRRRDRTNEHEEEKAWWS